MGVARFAAKAWPACIVLAATCAFGWAGPAGKRVVLVELFTSEGCSSCPPADALLKKIDGAKVDNGTLIVGLSEHVTYWNNLGWRDPFSQDLFTARQNAYGERFRLNSVYTPQMVVNGERQVLGSDGRAVLKAVAEAAAESPVSLTIQSVVPSGKMLAVTYALSGAAPGAEVFAVVAEDMASSDVARGENSGRTLTHVSVARSLVRVGPGSAGIRTVSVDAPDGVKGRHLVMVVQGAGVGKVLAVDSRGL
jgi:hypothetical protein